MHIFENQITNIDMPEIKLSSFCAFVFSLVFFIFLSLNLFAMDSRKNQNETICSGSLFGLEDIDEIVVDIELEKPENLGNSFQDTIVQPGLRGFTTARPPMSEEIVFKKFGAGLAGQAAGAIAGGLIGALTQMNKGGWDALSGFVIGGGLGSIAGSALGVTIVANEGYLKGSYLAALLGSTLGSAVSVALISAGSHAVSEVVGITSLFILPSAGAVAGFALSRQYNMKNAVMSKMNIRVSPSAFGVSYSLR